MQGILNVKNSTPNILKIKVCNNKGLQSFSFWLLAIQIFQQGVLNAKTQNCQQWLAVH